MLHRLWDHKNFFCLDFFPEKTKTSVFDDKSAGSLSNELSLRASRTCEENASSRNGAWSNARIATVQSPRIRSSDAGSSDIEDNSPSQPVGRGSRSRRTPSRSPPDNSCINSSEWARLRTYVPTLGKETFDDRSTINDNEPDDYFTLRIALSTVQTAV